MAHDVFISHSSVNKTIANAICHALEKNNVRCWIAPRDIPAGTQFGEQIIKGIRECKVFLLIFSDEVNRSPAVQKELERAVLGHKKTVIPFRIEDVPMNENIEFFLGDVHWINAYPDDTVFTELVTEVKNALGMGSTSSSVSEPIEPIVPPVAKKVKPTAKQPLTLKSKSLLTIALSLVLAVGLVFVGFALGGKKGKTDSILNDNLNLQRSANAKNVKVKLIVEPSLVFDDFPQDFREGLAIVQKNQKYGVINKKGNVVIPFTYDNNTGFSDGLAYINKDGKYGFIDHNGNMIIPPIYDMVHSFSEGLAQVCKDGKWGYIDKNGKEVIPFIYEGGDQFTGFYSNFSEGLARVKKGGKYGYIDKSGKEIIPIIYDFGCFPFEDGLAQVNKNGRTVYIDKNNDIVVTLDNYDNNHVSSFRDGLLIVYKNEKCGCIDKNGNVIVPLIYDEIWGFYNGLACVIKDGKYGFIDKNGNVVIDFKDSIWDDLDHSFTEGLSRVMKDGKTGFIDQYSNIVVPCIYDYASTWFNEGLAFVKKDGKWGIIEIEK